MSNPTFRRLQILTVLPRSPRKISATQLHSELESRGYEIDKRQVQKDLLLLAKEFDIESDNESIPGWCWAEHSNNNFARYGMNAHSALAFCLAAQHLRPLLPTASLRHLEEYFDEAKRTLAKQSGRPISEWGKRTLIAHRGIVPLSPKIILAVESALTKALVEGHKVRALYQKRGHDIKEYVLTPLGLLSRNNILYLIAESDESRLVPKSFAMHRFKSVDILAIKSLQPKTFDLAKLNESGEFGIPLGGLLKESVILKFELESGRAFFDTQISKDQKIIKEELASITIQFTTPNTKELRWWILGYGSRVEVVSPLSLRQEIQADLKKGLKNYSA